MKRKDSSKEGKRKRKGVKRVQGTEKEGN